MLKGNPPVPVFRAEGGLTGSDTVPALLTPGEHVISAQAVRCFGTDLMHAINSMRLSPEYVRSIADTRAQVHRFAEGGEVPGAAMPAASFAGAGAGGGNTYHVHVHANPGDLLSPENARRLLVPIFDDMERRKGRG